MRKWDIRKLGEVCDVVGGATPPKEKAEYYTGQIPWATVRDMRADVIERTEFKITEAAVALCSTNVIPAGNVIIATRVGLGKVCIAKFDTAINQDLRGIIPMRPSVMDQRFLFHWLCSVADKIVAEGTGATVQGVKLPFIKGLPIPVPSLSEQRRIVGILDEAFAGLEAMRANAEKNLQNARALFDQGFGQLVEEADKDGWRKTIVTDIAAPQKGSIRTGPFGSQLLHGEFVDEGIAVLGIDNAVANEFRWGKSRFITPEKYDKLKRYKVYRGDVIITIMGTCGRCAIVPDDIPTAINTKHLCCITLDPKKCLPAFLHASFLYSPASREYLTRQAKGSIMDGLNMGLIKDLPILLPPIATQQKIVERLDALKIETQNLGDLYQSKLTAIDELKKSLLHQAFSGNL